MPALLALAVVTLVAAGCGGSSSNGSSGGSNAVDRAFVRQMIPHHELAVEMATTAVNEAQHGQLKAGLAPVIVSAQKSEIAQMKAIARTLDVMPAAMHEGHMGGGDAATEKDATTLNVAVDAMGMSMDMGELAGAKPFDRAFVDAMIPHHQGAIRMARAELDRGSNAKLEVIAKGIVAAQTREIKQMNSWRARWYGAPSPAGGVPSA